MRNLKDIRQMLSDCGASIVGTKKEVKELTRIIKDNEIITYATSGWYDGHTWLVVSTTKRIILLDKGMLFGVNQIEIPLGKVNAVKYKKGLFMGEVEIWDGASMFKVNETIGEFEKSQKSSGSSVADEIIKLKKLMDEGVITRNEFEKKKNELLK